MKRTKKLLSLILILCMVLGVMPGATYAANTTVNSAAELNNALTNAVDGTVITLGSNITSSSSYLRNTAVTITIDGQSLYTLTGLEGSASTALTVEGAGIVILKNLNIVGGIATNGSSIGLQVNNDARVQCDGTVNVTGGTAVGDSYGMKTAGNKTVNITSATGGSGTNASYGVYNSGTGTVNVNIATGGSVTNGISYGVYNAKGITNVKNASGFGSTGNGVYNTQNGNVNATTASGSSSSPGNGAYNDSYYSGVVNVATVTGRGSGNINTNIAQLTLNKGASSCVLDFITIASSGSTTVGVLPGVYKDGTPGVWYADISKTTAFSGTTVSGATTLYSTFSIPDVAISISAIGGVSVPATGGIPTSVLNATDEYTAEIAWSDSPSIFAENTVYTATITITPKLGYTLTGVSENFFTVAGASATNTANSGVIIASFPATVPYCASITRSGATIDYPTLTAALAAAVNGDTITLLKDITESVSYTVSSDKTITIDGQNHKIIGVDTTDKDSIALTIDGIGNINLKNITLQAGVATNNHASCGLYVTGDANVNAYGTVNAFGNTAINSWGVANNGSGTVNVTTATGNDYGITNSSTGTVNVTTATSPSIGVYNRSGTVNVGTATGHMRGVENTGSGTVNVTTASANGTYGATFQACGVYNVGSGTVNAGTATGNVSGIINKSTGTVNVTTDISPSISDYNSDLGTINVGIATATIVLNKGTDGNCVLDSITVAETGDTNVGILPNVTKNGVAGVWYTDSAKTIAFSGTTVTSATTLYSNFSNTVTFDANGGETPSSPTTKTALSAGTIGSLPTAPTKADYTFNGWNTLADGSGSAFTGATAVSSNITVYAQWILTPIVYTVTFDNNGGDTQASPIAKTGLSDGTLGSLPTAPTKAGNTFNGWNTLANGSGSAFTGATAVSSNITVYAQWILTPIVYTVTFDKNGGDTLISPTTKTALSGSTIGSLPTAPTKAGNTFNGWNTLANGIGTAFTAATAVNANITVYAQWTLTPVVYTVTFDKNGGDTLISPTTKTALSDGTLGSLPTAPTKAGNTFNGWNTLANGSGTAFTAATAVGADITVYAQWTLIPVVYTVTFDKNGGDTQASPIEKMGLSDGTLGSLPTAPTRAGYTFSGWNTLANGGGTVFTAATVVSANFTVYAQWMVISAGNGGSTGGTSSESNTGIIPVVIPKTTLTETSPPGNSVATITSMTSTDAKSDSNGTAAASVTQSQLTDALKEATEAAAKKGEGTQTKVEIRVNAPADTKSVETSIPLAAFIAVEASNTSALTVTTPIAALTFDAQALSAIAGGATGEIKITTSIVEAATLSDETKQAVGDRPVFNFSVTSGKQTISQFGGNVTVAVPYTPKAGENLDAIVIYYINAEGKLEIVSNCSYDPTTGSITFTTNHFSKYAVGYNKVTFTDVATNAWYSKAVEFAAARGITTGTGEGTFSPDNTLTRGQFLVMAMRAYGLQPLQNSKNNFVDSGNTYYTGYLAAAKSLGISDGIGNNQYAPEAEITRQETFALLYKILKLTGELPTGTTDQKIATFSDRDMIEPWAMDAVTLFVKTGVINGSHGKLTPTGTTNRAEMAQVIYNLLSQ